MKIRLVQGASIRALGLDLRRMCFAFSPDYLSAVAVRRGGYSGVYEIEIQEGRFYIPVVLFTRKFLKLMTIQAPPSDENGRRLRPEHETAALEALTAHIRSSGVAHRITQPTNWSVFQGAPMGAVSAPFGSYVLPLELGIDALWRRLHQKHRNAIRNAERKCVGVANGRDEVENCFSLYQKTMRRNGMACEPIELFEGLLGSDDFEVFCAVAYVGERAVSALFAPYNTYGAYYLFGGTSKDIGTNGANNLLHFEAIRAFTAHGAAFYDFVGARIGKVEDRRLDGIQRFKARFGAELKQGVLWKQDLSAMHCTVYDALLSLRNLATGRRKAMDIIDQQQRALDEHG